MTKYKVTASQLRIRSGPGLTYSVKGFLVRDAIVDGEEVNGDWVHITTQDKKTGWCHHDYLELWSDVPPTPSQTVYRVATTLNLRYGPGLNYSVIGSLASEELVDGLAISNDGGWAQVRRASGLTGWASLQYLAKIAPLPPPDPNNILMLVTIDSLNVRAGPALGYSIIGQVHRGEVVTYLDATPLWDWVHIKTGQDQVGWCSSQYLTDKPDLLAPAEDYTATGLHRALTDSLSLREGPGEMYAQAVPVNFNAVLNVDLVSPNGKWKHGSNAWGQSGWYPVERLAKLGEVAVQKEEEEFPYLPIAFAELGTREIPGRAHNPRIQEYIYSTDLAKYPSLPDETDWCACFVNWCIEKAGLSSTNSAIVSPWRNWGIKPDSPCRGSVITFRWDDGGEHVSFYLGDIGNYVVCLGGNQSNAVWISVYHKKYITAYRVPS